MNEGPILKHFKRH